MSCNSEQQQLITQDLFFHLSLNSNSSIFWALLRKGRIWLQIEQIFLDNTVKLFPNRTEMLVVMENQREAGRMNTFFTTLNYVNN